MKAIALNDFGGSEVLHVAELEKPAARPGTVVVRVAHAGVNPADWKVREGWLKSFFNYDFPFVLGFDAAGIVDSVGEGVTGLKPGDRVVAASNQGLGERGTYAEYVLSDRERVVPLPENISFPDAAALPTAGMTAWEAVFDVGKAESGQKVFVNGGAGGTGSFAIQLARMAGASVATTCSPANDAYVASLGAECVIDYRRESVPDRLKDWAPDGVDLIIDTVGQGTVVDTLRNLRRGGIFTHIATLIPDERLPDNAEAAGLGVEILPSMSNYANQSRQLHALVAALADGRIAAPHVAVLPLAEAARALDRVQEGHVRGKIVLEVDKGLT